MSFGLRRHGFHFGEQTEDGGIDSARNLVGQRQSRYEDELAVDICQWRDQGGCGHQWENIVETISMLEGFESMG